MSKFLSVKSVAKRYEIGVSTVWYWLKIGHLPNPVKLAANTTRWSVDSLDEFDNQKGHQSYHPRSFPGTN